MINQFHADSQEELVGRVSRPSEPDMQTNDLISFSQAIDDAMNFWKLRDRQKRAHYLNDIQRRRELVLDRPDNLWQVYELCKDIYELAELDRVDFNGATLTEKMKFIKAVVPFAKSRSLREGVIEYHMSRKSWRMNFLTVDSKETETTTL